MPSISYAYGIFIDDTLEGVVTFGKPSSRTLCIGVCGEEFEPHVIELNRLYINDEVSQSKDYHNLASQLVGYGLKQLKPLNKIVISFSDNGMHHSGIIYKATNFIYTGKSAKRTDAYIPYHHSRAFVKGMHYHYRVFRSTKDRYIYFSGDKRFVKQAKQNLNYKIEEYPVSDSKHYQIGDVKDQLIKDTETGDIFYESTLTESKKQEIAQEIEEQEKELKNNK